jgi:serine/threonine-protein kinase RsbW
MRLCEPQSGRLPVGELIPDSATRRIMSVRGLAEVSAVLESVVGSMAAEAYPERDVFGVRLALEEALANAIKHGNQCNPAKWVRITFDVNADRVMVQVEDAGAGFDPDGVPDPRERENLDRPHGRGLLLMRHYTTWLSFNEPGNRVTLCKVRSEQ